ncbi:hypothetical protein [Neobacillus dielmonensis]|uniref:hypothetical protein n=1 Tax=Neobacillus dielmonensis TaxID=1347369 RepID=UPI00069494AC|nr:hypothetical protein [Neobacillus dielmonensis]
MELALAILFGGSAILLIVSIFMTKKASVKENKQIDLIHVAVMKDVNEIRESIRNLELDLEVVSTEAGLQLSADERTLKREILDLYKRNYSIKSIAEMKQVPESEISYLLAPYLSEREERRQAVNEN